MKKVAIIGQYGKSQDYLTGQAVKTTTCADWMIQKYGENNVMIVNSFGWKKHPVRLLKEVVHAMAQCKNIMVFPATNGIEVFPSLLVALNKIYHRKLFLVVIGGWLGDFCERKRRLRHAVASFDNVLAETDALASQLRQLGIVASTLPNFRSFKQALPKDQANHHVCTYSRVTKTKGIDDALAIVKKANALLGKDIFFLDVYGKIDRAYEEEFIDMCKKEKDIMHYGGAILEDAKLTVLQKQFAILFPTFYEGECFPGTALDAFETKTPIIANDWKYIREIIRDGENGLVYPFRDTTVASSKLVALYQDPMLYQKIQEGCSQSCQAYDTARLLEETCKNMA